MKRIWVFLIGLFTVIAFLEMGLRLVGVFYLRDRTACNTLSRAAGYNRYVILCLGNSYTFGSGALPSQSYPKQLQRLLDKKFNYQVTVINGGMANENTAELLDVLEARIKEADPDLIVLQTGQANFANNMYYNRHLDRVTGRNIFHKKKIFYLHDFLSQSRAYRLVSLLYGNVKNKLSSSYKRKKGYPQAQELTYSMIAAVMSPKKTFYVDKQRSEEAIALFLRGVKVDPHYPGNYVSLGLIYFYRDNYEEALKWFIKAVEVNPTFREEGEFNRGYLLIRLMRTVDKGVHNNEINKRIDEFIDRFKKKEPDNSMNLLSLTDEEVGAWVESDIKEILRIVREKNIKIIIQNYPMPLSLNAVLRKISEELKVPFVDNEAIFKDKIDNGIARESLFALDGHCNANGYGVMAMNVYNKIMEAGLLKLLESNR